MNPTVVDQSPGSVSLSLTHAGNVYPGSVDRTGHFRPRVIYAPSGAYYLYNGAPYPWVTTHERDIMPYIVD